MNVFIHSVFTLRVRCVALWHPKCVCVSGASANYSVTWTQFYLNSEHSENSLHLLTEFVFEKEEKKMMLENSVFSVFRHRNSFVAGTCHFSSAARMSAVIVWKQYQFCSFIFIFLRCWSYWIAVVHFVQYHVSFLDQFVIDWAKRLISCVTQHVFESKCTHTPTHTKGSTCCSEFVSTKERVAIRCLHFHSSLRFLFDLLFLLLFLQIALTCIVCARVLLAPGKFLFFLPCVTLLKKFMAPMAQ